LCGSFNSYQKQREKFENNEYEENEGPNELTWNFKGVEWDMGVKAKG
jgi:hypothetical protein